MRERGQTRKGLKALRAEVERLYLRHINYELSDEEFSAYYEKDRRLAAMERAMGV